MLFRSWMHNNQQDYTNTFYFLTSQKESKSEIYDSQNFNDWKSLWKRRLKKNNAPLDKSYNLMRKSNPAVIPRNDKVEEALIYASKNNNFSKIYELLKVLQNPYDYSTEFGSYQSVPDLDNEKYKTFCGT